MAPLLRHPIGESSAITPSLTAPLRRFVRSTLASYEGPHGDRSFLLIRERPSLVPLGDLVVLRGDFGAPARGRLASLLAALPIGNRKPLHIDLRRITSLDEGCLSLLLKARRDHAACRSVIFQVAEAGLVREMIGLFGLRRSLGLEKSLPITSGDTLPARLATQGLKTDSSKEGSAPSVQPAQ